MIINDYQMVRQRLLLPIGGRMAEKQNPFTHTYGSAGKAYIDMKWAERVIENFGYEEPSEYVYKITGVRGSGKTVVLSDIIRYFTSADQVKKGWLVYDLSSARDPLHTLVAYLAKEKLSKVTGKNTEVNLSASFGFISGSISSDNSVPDKYYDDEVELDELIGKATGKGKKILVCIDDIAKTEAVVAFCSVYAKYIRAEKPVYFVCTGLFSNMDALGRVRNLTFFRRAVSIEVRSLSDVSITTRYRKLLGVDMEEARKMAKITKGYAYAYQVLGSLYYNKDDSDGLEDLMDDFDELLFSQSYEKIWSELTEGEKNLILIMLDHKKREEILKEMDKPKNYSEYRNSLKKGGIISEASRGEIAFCLPHFEEYVRYYCS